MTDAERIAELEEELEAKEVLLAEAESEAADKYSLSEMSKLLPDLLISVECRRCHKVFMGHPDQRWCTEACRLGQSPAPTYEQWYREVLHPNRSYEPALWRAS